MAKTLGRILVVEDNKDLRMILASLLQLIRYEAIVAESGKEALEKAVTTDPDIILLDLNLPDVPGVEVARQIRKNPASANIPIVGCSAFSAGDEREDALTAGMVEYLQKPISTDQLSKTIERFISLKGQG